jgi:hypothetical protein
MTDALCPACSAQAAAGRVTLHREPWATSPAPYLSGMIADLMALRAAGMAQRDPAGWWIPTAAFPTPTSNRKRG